MLLMRHNTVLKMALKCSFAPRKIGFFACFYLASANFNNLIKGISKNLKTTVLEIPQNAHVLNLYITLFRPFMTVFAMLVTHIAK